ncbi:hypothetical protein WA158_000159 [Blastocystis sp. Blastoise]
MNNYLFPNVGVSHLQSGYSQPTIPAQPTTMGNPQNTFGNPGSSRSCLESYRELNSMDIPNVGPSDVGNNKPIFAQSPFGDMNQSNSQLPPPPPVSMLFNPSNNANEHRTNDQNSLQANGNANFNQNMNVSQGNNGASFDRDHMPSFPPMNQPNTNNGNKTPSFPPMNHPNINTNNDNKTPFFPPMNHPNINANNGNNMHFFPPMNHPNINANNGNKTPSFPPMNHPNINTNNRDQMPSFPPMNHPNINTNNRDQMPSFPRMNQPNINTNNRDQMPSFPRMNQPNINTNNRDQMPSFPPVNQPNINTNNNINESFRKVMDPPSFFTNNSTKPSFFMPPQRVPYKTNNNMNSNNNNNNNNTSPVLNPSINLSMNIPAVNLSNINGSPSFMDSNSPVLNPMNINNSSTGSPKLVQPQPFLYKTDASSVSNAQEQRDPVYFPPRPSTHGKSPVPSIPTTTTLGGDISNTGHLSPTYHAQEEISSPSPPPLFFFKPNNPKTNLRSSLPPPPPLHNNKPNTASSTAQSTSASKNSTNLVSPPPFGIFPKASSFVPVESQQHSPSPSSPSSPIPNANRSRDASFIFSDDKQEKFFDHIPAKSNRYISEMMNESSTSEEEEEAKEKKMNINIQEPKMNNLHEINGSSRYVDVPQQPQYSPVVNQSDSDDNNQHAFNNSNNIKRDDYSNDNNAFRRKNSDHNDPFNPYQNGFNYKEPEINYSSHVQFVGLQDPPINREDSSDTNSDAEFENINRVDSCCFDRSRMKCDLCLRKRDNNLLYLYVCSKNHVCCQDCISNYINHWLEDNRVTSLYPTCPHKGCTENLEPMLFRNLDSKLEEKINDKSVRVMLSQENNHNSDQKEYAVNCPCGNSFICEEGDPHACYDITDDNGVRLNPVHSEHYNMYRTRCRNCNNSICIKCMTSPYHMGYTCEEFQERKQAVLCRFCQEPIRNGHGCDNPDCQEKQKMACVKGERVHPQCIHNGCSHPPLPEGSEYCSLCYTSGLEDDCVVQLKCNHYFHYDCMKKYIEAYNGHSKITFQELCCPQCRQPIECEVLDSILKPLKDIKKKVEDMAENRLKYEHMDKSPEIVNPTGRFYHNPTGFALHHYVYFMCSKCHKPYFGGAANCSIAEANENDPERICGIKTCPKHGGEFITFKCKFCCNVASWFCWSTTHFCDSCHKKQNNGEGIAKKPRDQLPKCPGIEKCPLHIQHPPNGEEFSLGCSMCRADKEIGY